MTESHATPTPSAGDPGWEAIARFHAGESNAAEAAAVAAWLREHPEDERALAALSAMSERMQRDAQSGIDVEAALARVHDRMRSSETPVVPLHAAPRSLARRPTLWWTAAAAVGLLAVGIARRGNAPSVEAARVVTTPVGRVDTTRLADGTVVVLGPSSELTIAAGYATGERRVQLRGTAFFEVRHDAQHPFSVRAGNVVVSDIGTAFSVRTDGAEDVDVSVREGAVRFTAASGNSVDLAAGDRALTQAAGAVTVRRAGASDDDAAFTRGRLVFRDTPVRRVRDDLRRWFGVELVVADSTLAARHLTASFAHESREQVMSVIALALGASYDMRGDTVTLRPASLTARPRK